MIHLVPAKALIAKLTPMRPILCVVVTGNTTKKMKKNSLLRIDDSAAVGFALSDPYLGSASPLPSVVAQTAAENDVKDDIYRAIRLHKPGGLAFAFPMKAVDYFRGNDLSDRHDINNINPESLCAKDDDDCDGHVTTGQRASLLNYLQSPATTVVGTATPTTTNDYSTKTLTMMACTIDERLTVDEAWQMARGEVEQWEDVVDLLQERRSQQRYEEKRLDLSLDAAVALNQFLWTHTGGWRNTFG